MGDDSSNPGPRGPNPSHEPAEAGIAFGLTPVRILGVRVIQFTSRTVGSGTQAIDVRRRARVIAGNLNLLYLPVRLR